MIKEEYEEKINKIMSCKNVFQKDKVNELVFEFVNDCKSLRSSDIDDVIHIATIITSLINHVDKKDMQYLKKYLG